MPALISSSLIEHLPTSAKDRKRQVPVRVFLALLLAWTLHATGQDQWIVLWLCAATAVQLFEILAMAPFRGPEAMRQPRWKAALAIASTVAMSCTYCGLATYFGSIGGFVPLTVALLILAGGMLQNVASGVESRGLFYIGVAPYAASLALLPVAAFEHTSGMLPILLVALALFAGAVHGVWKRTHLARKAEIAAREEAERRRGEAEEAVADRAAMAAIVSHELRTPLSAIVAGAQMIHRTEASAASRETAALVIDAGRLMTGLLNDLLDNAKIEAGAMSLEARDFDLTAALTDAARFWSAVAAQKAIGFETVLPTSPFWVRGDPHRLRQILNNLLSNAIKFTVVGQVSLRLEPRADGSLRIIVGDQGPGLDDEAMERIFTPYAQGSQEVARTYGGTGLGLTVSRELARLMGGDLTARPAPDGMGAEFLVTLRLPEGAVAAEDGDAQEPMLPRPGLKVLAVDDHEINRRTLSLVLQPVEARLTTAIDGVSALELLQAEAFDVVLMDVNMPGMDGVEATRRLRAGRGPNQSTPVIGFSAGVETEQAALCLEAGMNDWIPKPLDTRRLYESLAQATGD